MPFNRVFSDEQRLAVEQAGVDRGIRPYTRISRMAAAGELQADGKDVEAFKIDHRTVGYMVRTEDRRRKGEAGSQLIKQAPMDAVDTLRRRLLSIADRGVQQLENQSRQKAVDAKRLLEYTRVTTQLAVLSKTTMIARAPGRPPSLRPGGADKSMATDALKALRATNDDADTANVHTAEATDPAGTERREPASPWDDGDRGDLVMVPGTQQNHVLPAYSGVAADLHQQLYGTQS